MVNVFVTSLAWHRYREVRVAILTVLRFFEYFREILFTSGAVLV